MLAPGFVVSRPLAALTAASACFLTAAASCLAVGTFAPFLATVTRRLHAGMQVAVDLVGPGLGELHRHRLGLLAGQAGLDLLGAGVGELLAVGGLGEAGLRLSASWPLNQNAAPAASSGRRPSGRSGRRVRAARRSSSAGSRCENRRARRTRSRRRSLSASSGRRRWRCSPRRASWRSRQAARVHLFCLRLRGRRHEESDGGTGDCRGPERNHQWRSFEGVTHIQKAERQRCQASGEGVWRVRGSMYGYLHRGVRAPLPGSRGNSLGAMLR